MVCTSEPCMLAYNNIFNKTMENLWKWVVSKLHTYAADKLQQLIANPPSLDAPSLTVTLACDQAVVESTSQMEICIRDLLKLLLYDWYNHLKSIYGEQAQHLYTDTNLLVL